MARQFHGGFELNSLSLEFEQTYGSTISISTSTVRSGGYAGKVLNPANLPAGWRKAFLATAVSTGKWYGRVGFNIAANPSAVTSVLMMSNSTAANVQGCRSVAVTTAGALRLYDSTGTQVGSDTSAVGAGWHVVDLLIDYTTPKCEVRLDGTVVITDNTMANTTTISQMYFGACLGTKLANTMEIYFDDYALNDNSGNNQTGYVDKLEKFLIARPNGVPTTNSFPSHNFTIQGTSPAATTWQSINETPPDESVTYIQRDAVAGSASRGSDFTIDSPTTVGIRSADTVTCVQAHIRGSANSTADATTRNVFLRLKSADGGTVLESANSVHLNVNVATPTWVTDGTSNTTTPPWPLPPLTSYGVDHTTGAPLGDAASGLDAWPSSGAHSLLNAQLGIRSESTVGNAANANATALWLYIGVIPGPLLVTVNDLLSMSDTVATVSTILRTVTDNENLTDTMIPEAGGSTITRTLADTFTMTDVVPRAFTAILTDNLGLDDSGIAVTSSPDHFDMVDYLSRGLTRTITDHLALTDSVALVTQAPGVVNITDRLNLTDSVSTARNLTRTISDSLGMTDTVTATTALQVLVDAVFEIGRERDGWRIG